MEGGVGFRFSAPLFLLVSGGLALLARKDIGWI
jgi:hypothetical protein